MRVLITSYLLLALQLPLHLDCADMVPDRDAGEAAGGDDDPSDSSEDSTDEMMDQPKMFFPNRWT